MKVRKKKKIDKANALEEIKSLRINIYEKNCEIIKLKEKNYQLLDLLDRYSNQLKEYEEILINSLESEEKSLLNNIYNLKNISKKDKKLKIIESKYNALKNSKLGKLTLRYWSFRNKMRGKII